MSHPQRPLRSLRSITALLGVLLAAAALLVGTAGAAAAQPVQDCTPWERVPLTEVDDPANDGYVNDRHGRAWAERQQCSAVPGGPQVQTYARAVYDQFRPDEETLESEGVRLRILDVTGGCFGCVVLLETDRRPEPGVGSSIVSGGRVLLDPAGSYAVEADITYVDPPSPFWFQSGILEFRASTEQPCPECAAVTGAG